MDNLPVTSGEEKIATTPCSTTDSGVTLNEGQALAQTGGEAAQAKEVPTESGTYSEVTTTQPAPMNMPVDSAPAPVDTGGSEAFSSLPANTGQPPSTHFTNPMLFSAREVVARLRARSHGKPRHFSRPRVRRRSRGQQGMQPVSRPDSQPSPVQVPFPNVGYFVGAMPNSTPAFQYPGGMAVVARPWTHAYAPYNGFQLGAQFGTFGGGYPLQLRLMPQMESLMRMHNSEGAENLQRLNDKTHSLNTQIAFENARAFEKKVEREKQESLRNRPQNLVVNGSRGWESYYRNQLEGNALVSDYGMAPAFTPENAYSNSNMEQDLEATESEDEKSVTGDDHLTSETPVALRRCNSCEF
ncbi:hypothetical protein CMQ_5208 [Grosmannia clavigera kw1407]|uniref:Uncharacterized protein n=2 Tax=Leptographium clavigerum TaxID=226899 RepID=F0XBB7_GROCL|nr:uncharacterized protein CMQ_5208 [Grosmannia clavigera kw1407]EFX04946.1 hypothetical protein CMQ_5208 [Grosmannia clavigera kw1407]